MADSPIERAIARRRELQNRIREAMLELGEVSKFISMYSKYVSAEDLGAASEIEDESLGMAGAGMAQPVFEELVIMIMEEINRPLTSGEVVEEFRLRGHPIGGLNPVKTAWNRLWQAKVNAKLVHLPPLGYWLPDKPLPKNLKMPEKGERFRLRNPRRHIEKEKARRGAPRALTDEMVAAADRMRAEGMSVRDIAAALGGVSVNTVYQYLEGGRRSAKSKKGEFDTDD